MNPWGNYTVPTTAEDGYTDDFVNAGLYVGMMLGVSAIFLMVLKRSGFRAMVAVGRG